MEIFTVKKNCILLINIHRCWLINYFTLNIHLLLGANVHFWHLLVLHFFFYNGQMKCFG